MLVPKLHAASSVASVFAASGSGGEPATAAGAPMTPGPASFQNVQGVVTVPVILQFDPLHVPLGFPMWILFMLSTAPLTVKSPPPVTSMPQPQSHWAAQILLSFA